jgi:TetR/AcrR family fatty acid metabolism transcriptional regulator
MRGRPRESMETERTTEERRQDRKLERRQAILRGAVRVFADKGFFHATVAEIARQAGVADGTIYLYFKSKDDILLSIFDDQMAQLTEAAREAVQGLSSAAEALTAVVGLHLGAVVENPSLAAVLIMELRQSVLFVRDAEKARLTAYLNLIGEVVARGQKTGEFRSDVHPAAMKRALFGALDELTHGWLVARGRKFDLVRSGREVAELFVRGLKATPGD